MSRYLVDGMNVIGCRPDGWWRDRPAAVVTLVKLLTAWAGAEAAQVTAVFDGDPPPGLAPPGPEGPVGLAFAGRGASADDEIAWRVATDPDPATLTVVTSDRELAARVRAGGATVVGSAGFRRRLDGPAW